MNNPQQPGQQPRPLQVPTRPPMTPPAQQHGTPGAPPKIAAMPVEIEAAARQFVRKISGVQSLGPNTEEAFERAVAAVTEAATTLLDELPPRRVPPKNDPPLRRIAAAKLATERAKEEAASA